MCSRCVEWDGKVWHKYGEGHYRTMVYLHRAIWEKEVGPIPEGYHVHHKNDDKGDNSLDNLEILSVHDHNAHHLDAKIGPYRVIAHARSRESNARARQKRLERELSCAVCGGPYRSGAITHSAFCSP